MFKIAYIILLMIATLKSDRVTVLKSVPVLSMDTEFAVSNSLNTAPTDGWQSERPDISSSDVLWQRIKVTYSDGTIEYLTPTPASGESGKAYAVYISSSKGTTLTNKKISTTLSCNVLVNGNDVSSTLAESSFTWSRSSEDQSSDTVWNKQDKLVGSRSLAITESDLNGYTTFTCKVTLEEGSTLSALIQINVAKDNTLIQYQYGSSDRTPPVSIILFRFAGSTVKFRNGLVVDGADDDWKDSATELAKDSTKPYLWMRISVDNGDTWKYAVITGPAASFFELKCTKDTYRLNDRGVVDYPDTLTFYAVTHNMGSNEHYQWAVTPSGLMDIDANKDIDLTAESITITIPTGYENDYSIKYVEVSLKIGYIGDAVSMKVYGQISGTQKPEKQPLVYLEENLPTTAADGISPLIEGDYCTVEYVNGDRYPYIYKKLQDDNGDYYYGWQRATGDEDDAATVMTGLLAEMLDGENVDEVCSSYYAWFKNLTAYNAFIDNIFATYAKITGAIYGGDYELDKATNKIFLKSEDGTGFAINADGQMLANNIEVSGAVINNARITDAKVYGELKSNTIWTSSAVDDSNLSWMNEYTFPNDLYSLSLAYNKIASENRSMLASLTTISGTYGDFSIAKACMTSSSNYPTSVKERSVDSNTYYPLIPGAEYKTSISQGSSGGWIIKPLKNWNSYPIWVEGKCWSSGGQTKMEVWPDLDSSKYSDCWDGLNTWILPDEAIGIWGRYSGSKNGDIKSYYSNGIPPIGYSKLGNLSVTSLAGGGEYEATRVSAVVPDGAYAVFYMVRGFEIDGYGNLYIYRGSTRIYDAPGKGSMLQGLAECTPGDTIEFYIGAAGYTRHKHGDSADDGDTDYRSTVTAKGCDLVFLPNASAKNAIIAYSSDMSEKPAYIDCSSSIDESTNWQYSSTRLSLGSYDSDSNLTKVSGTAVYDKMFEIYSSFELNYSGHTNYITVNGDTIERFRSVSKISDSILLEYASGNTFYRLYRLGLDNDKGFYDSISLNLYPVSDQEQVRTKKLVPKTNSSTSEDPKTGISYDIGEEDNRYNTVYANELFSGSLKLDNLPTSSDGLATGQVWNDNGTLKIKT